jgi:hypothetical protein
LSGLDTLDPVLLAGALFIGCFIGDLTLRRGLIIYRFGLLMACRWYKEDRLVSFTPVIRYTVILLFYAVLFISVTIIVIKGYPDYIGPYLSGVAIMFIYGHSKSTEGIFNTDNFVKFNIEYIRDNEVDSNKNNQHIKSIRRDAVSTGIDDKNEIT